MTALVHGDFRPDVRTPHFIVLPDGMTEDEGRHIVTVATQLHDLALDLAKAGA